MNNFIIQESPELFVLCIVSIIFGFIYNIYFMIISIIVLVVLLYLYRKPTIKIEPNNNYLVSPAFGTISRILPQKDNRLLVSIFLSPLNIHSQYFPCNGKLVHQTYDNTGKFKIASDAYKSDANEKIITIMQSDVDVIKITQISGFFFRCISNPPYHSGNKKKQGDYLGFIKFGSRVDIEFSLDKYNILPHIKVGSVLCGPNTKIAKK